MQEEYIVIEIADERETDIKLMLEEEAGGEYPEYTGAYRVTPSLDAQTLKTAYRLLTNDVVIEPIPSNYGKISYDGSTLYIT